MEKNVNLIIDAHIHFDKYAEEERTDILRSIKKHRVDQLISVSNNLASAKSNLFLSRKNQEVHAAFGYHPEQKLPSDLELDGIHSFMEKYQNEMVAVGEVGLPYYRRKADSSISIEGYLEVLEEFILAAKRLDKPIILHAVYDDAPMVCELLEKHSMDKAHFHWFKGDPVTVERMIQNNYFISVTPDVVYKEKIQEIVSTYPLSNMMVETDGPWPFEGPFKNTMTHPKMIHRTIGVMAKIKKVEVNEVYKKLYQNTTTFYGV